MIDVSNYEKLLSKGIGLDHYYVISMIYNNKKIPSNPRIQGFANTLIKRGLLVEGGFLSEEAIDLAQLDIFNMNNTPSISTEVVDTQLPFKDWVGYLHSKLQDKLYELTGKKQVRDRIKNGTAYSFLCNKVDLEKNLQKVMKLYKILDREAIQNTLLSHIENCHKGNNWFPILYYYIMKDGKSQLVTDLENEVEDSEFTSETLI